MKTILTVAILIVILAGLGMGMYWRTHPGISWFGDSGTMMNREGRLGSQNGPDVFASRQSIMESQKVGDISAIDCKKVSDKELGALGDSIIVRMAGNEEMRARMEEMMAGEDDSKILALRIATGKMYLGCGDDLMEGALSLLQTPIALRRSPAVGDYLTDLKGKTLYSFSKDSNGKSACSDQCLLAWPPYRSSVKDANAANANLGTIKRVDGTYQFTWKGMPLYYYQSDKAVGDVNGEGVKDSWHVVRP